MYPDIDHSQFSMRKEIRDGQLVAIRDEEVADNGGEQDREDASKN